jgi:hypothetical protein
MNMLNMLPFYHEIILLPHSEIKKTFDEEIIKKRQSVRDAQYKILEEKYNDFCFKLNEAINQKTGD